MWTSYILGMLSGAIDQFLLGDMTDNIDMVTKFGVP